MPKLSTLPDKYINTVSYINFELPQELNTTSSYIPLTINKKNLDNFININILIESIMKIRKIEIPDYNCIETDDNIVINTTSELSINNKKIYMDNLKNIIENNQKNIDMLNYILDKINNFNEYYDFNIIQKQIQNDSTLLFIKDIYNKIAFKNTNNGKYYIYIEL